MHTRIMIPGDEPEPIYFDLAVIALGVVVAVFGVKFARVPERAVDLMRSLASHLYGKRISHRLYTVENARFGFVAWIPLGGLLFFAGLVGLMTHFL